MNHNESNSQSKGWSIFSNVCAALLLISIFFGMTYAALYAADKEALVKQSAEVVK